MKIISWNCNGAFRKKHPALNEFNADILVIQECEDPSRTKYSDLFLNQYPHIVWTGDNKSKGLCIFSKLELENNDWKSDQVKLFISCKVANQFNLIGTWCHKADSPTFGYIGQLWKYIVLNYNKLDEKETIICGDLNSNKKWDVWDRWWNHSDVVRILDDFGINSLYHLHNREEQGKESQSTFFHQKNIDKAYHIDYMFASKKYRDALESIEVLDFEYWKQYSDHVPLLCVLNVSRLNN